MSEEKLTVGSIVEVLRPPSLRGARAVVVHVVPSGTVVGGQCYPDGFVNVRLVQKPKDAGVKIYGTASPNDDFLTIEEATCEHRSVEYVKNPSSDRGWSGWRCTDCYEEFVPIAACSEQERTT